MIEVVKQQLDGEDTIIRMYECYGARTKASLTLGCIPSSVKVVNMLEDEIGDACWNGNQVSVSLKPYEILTLKVKI